ncbi:MAG: tetratricopeptide repeat protein [Bacteroidales bacterium]|nr:tetratricopeptide repeat protein [Bacteroidales bacterium]MDE7465442.1 tetratricopeptide repeat protein [Muribaculaceae bacterium]
MKFKGLLSLCLAGMALSASAQTHVEGKEYFHADQYNYAQDLLKRSLSNPQTDKSVSNYYLGCIAILAEKPADAKKYFEAGVAANATNAFNHVGLGQLMLAANDVKGAKAEFKIAEGLAKKDPALSVAIARAYYDVDPVAYEKDIEKYLDKARKDSKNTSAEVLIFEGDRLKDQKEYGPAGSKYEMATTFDETASPAYVKYANLFNQVNPDFAINMLQKLLQKNPTSALGQHELAEAYYNKKDYKNAAAEYGKYVNNPSHFKSDESRYAFLLFYDNRFKDGYDFASKLLAQDPNNFTAQRYQFMNAAQIKEMKDQMLPLAEALYAAHKKDPKQNRFAAIDYTLIAGELQDAKRIDEAADVLQEAITEMPDNANLYKQLAFTYIAGDGMMDKAADAYQKYIKANADAGYNDFVQQALLDYYAGVQAQGNNNTEQAASYFANANDYAAKAFAIMENYKPKMIMGDIVKAQAGKDKAATAAQPLYEEAAALIAASPDPSKYARDAKTIYAYLGNYYYTNRQDAKAKEYFNKYLEIDPNNEQIRKFADSLK